MSRYKIAGLPIPPAPPPGPTGADADIAKALEVLNAPAPALPAVETASEGTHPLVLSPEEGLFAVPVEQMISQLQKLLRAKYTAVLMYMNYGDRLRAHYRDAIYAHFNDHMAEERTAAYDLAMKITALGGEPAAKVSTVPDVSELHQILLTVLQHEKELIALGREILQQVGDNVALKTWLEQTCFIDNQHADDARRLFACEVGTLNGG